jgi:hypothetical protein
VTRRWGAPAPEGVRHLVRAAHHPARAVDCPHCAAKAHAPCTTLNGRRLSPDRTPDQPPDPVHPARVTAWARTTACCPVCQVEPGTDCHNGGWPLPNGDVHPERQHEAEVTA